MKNQWFQLNGLATYLFVCMAIFYGNHAKANAHPSLKVVQCDSSARDLSFISNTSTKKPSSEPLYFDEITRGYKLNVIDFRHHDPTAEAIRKMHNLVRMEVISTYEKEGLATEKVVNTFMRGLDSKRAEPVSWYYISHTATNSTLSIVATAKMVRFHKSDMLPKSLISSSMLREALPLIPRFDLEKKSAPVYIPELGRKASYYLPEHEFFRQGPWIEAYTKLVKDFNRGRGSSDAHLKDKSQILEKIKKLWEQIPEEAFSIAEITGVTSRGFKELNFSALKVFMDQIKTDAKSYGLKRLYLLAASEGVREKWKKYGFKELEGGSYFDEASGMLKTKMYLDLDKSED